MKKTFGLILILLIMASATVVQAQYQNTSGQKREGTVKKDTRKKAKPRRWFAGGMLGAGFSSYSSYVQVSPLIGYQVTDAFQVGTRLTYIYNSYEVAPGHRANLNHYGASLFARYVFWKGLFAQAEYEALSFDYIEQPRQWINSLFIGGGYLQNIGGRGFASFAILFNVLDNQYSPYTNPIIRIGFGVGF